MGSGQSSQTNPINQKIIQDGSNDEMTFKLQNKKRKGVGYDGQAPTVRLPRLENCLPLHVGEASEQLYLMKHSITK